MKTKQEQIDAKKLKPIAIGDRVSINVPYTYNETVTEGRGKKKETKIVEKTALFHTDGDVIEIIPESEYGFIYVVGLGSIRVPSEVSIKTTYSGNSYKSEIFKAEYVSPTFVECGANPFKKESFRVNFFNQGIDSILHKACYGKRFMDYQEPQYSKFSAVDGELSGKTYGGINFNPYIIDINGEKQYYQRDLVWTLEQNQLLIDSIYNGIEIGKFLFRYKSWESLEKGAKDNGHGYSWDCVDGKQRFHAILHFIQNKFPDSYGNYWKDLAPNAQDKVLDYSKLSYGEMGETAKDADVIETFLTINFCGTPMPPEHLAFVQSIKI